MQLERQILSLSAPTFSLLPCQLCSTELASQWPLDWVALIGQSEANKKVSAQTLGLWRALGKLRMEARAQQVVFAKLSKVERLRALARVLGHSLPSSKKFLALDECSQLSWPLRARVGSNRTGNFRVHHAGKKASERASG